MQNEKDENKEIDTEPLLSEMEDSDAVELVYNEDGEEDWQATIQKLRKNIKKVQIEKDEYINNWQRERAEFANFKREESQRLSLAELRGKESIIKGLLPALDSFDMAMANKETWEKVDANWRVGVEYIRSQIATALEGAGVSVLAPTLGSVFDPNIQECIGLEKTEDKEKDHTISTLIQKGYMLGDKLLRPARVKVFDIQQ